MCLLHFKIISSEELSKNIQLYKMYKKKNNFFLLYRYLDFNKKFHNLPCKHIYKTLF